MCLFVDQKKTDKALKKRNGWKYAYKCLVHNGILLNSGVKSWYTWKPGWNKSDAEKPFIETQQEWNYQTNNIETNSIVNNGIHVLNSKKVLLTDYFNGEYYPEVCLRVKCYAKDLIAVDNAHEEVYTKVFVSKNDYRKALTAGKKRWLEVQKLNASYPSY